MGVSGSLNEFQSSHGLNGRAHPLLRRRPPRSVPVSILARSQRPCALTLLVAKGVCAEFQSSHGLNGRAHPAIQRRQDFLPQRFNPRTVSTAVRTSVGDVDRVPVRRVSILARSQRPCAPRWSIPARRRSACFNPRTVSTAVRTLRLPVRIVDLMRVSILARSQRPCAPLRPSHFRPNQGAFQSSHGLNGRAHPFTFQVESP